MIPDLYAPADLVVKSVSVGRIPPSVAFSQLQASTPRQPPSSSTSPRMYATYSPVSLHKSTYFHLASRSRWLRDHKCMRRLDGHLIRTNQSERGKFSKNRREGKGTTYDSCTEPQLRHSRSVLSHSCSSKPISDRRSRLLSRRRGRSRRIGRSRWLGLPLWLEVIVDLVGLIFKEAYRNVRETFDFEMCGRIMWKRVERAE